MNNDQQTTNRPLFCVISGPSGSGKTTVCREVATSLGWYYAVSHATRTKRENEVEGLDYLFISQEEFMTMVDQNEFLEWAKVYQNHYGTSKKVVKDRLDQGQSVIVDVDTQGALAIKKIMPEAILIFIKTKDIEELERRLKARGRDTEEEIQKRLEQTQEELKKVSKYDHSVINDDLNTTIEEIKNILLEYVT